MVRGRSLMLGAVLVGATFGCSSGGSDGSDGSDGAGPPAEVTRVVATGVVPVHDQVQLMDAAIVGVRMGDFGDDEDEVVVSLDDGRSWRAVSLPDRPAEFALSYPPHGLHVDRDVVVVAGRDEASAVPGYPVSQTEFRLWTSPDGVTWAGHVFETAGGTVGEPTVAEVGSLLVVAIGSVEGLNLYTSGDRGATWQRAEVTGLPHADNVTIEAVPTEDGGPLRLVGGGSSPAGGHVLTSEDDGATWEAEPCGETCPRPSDGDEVIRRRPDPSADDG